MEDSAGAHNLLDTYEKAIVVTEVLLLQLLLNGVKTTLGSLGRNISACFISFIFFNEKPEELRALRK